MNQYFYKRKPPRKSKFYRDSTATDNCIIYGNRVEDTGIIEERNGKFYKVTAINTNIHGYWNQCK